MYEQVWAAAACVTVNVWPAMVSAPLQAPPVLAAMLRFTEPLPVPDAPEAMVIHATEFAVVQAHPAAVVTWTLVLAALAGGLADCGLIE